MRRMSIVSLLLLGLATPAVAQTGDAKSAAKQTDEAQWLKYDAGSKTVTFALIAGVPSGRGPFNFNGYTSGGATLAVPAGSKVVLNFVNEDGTPHSAVIVPGDGPLPNAGGDAAIPAAYTRDVTQGLPQGGKDVLRFTAPANGSYRIICGVPGHALSGMWIWFKIDPQAKTPSFGESKQ